MPYKTLRDALVGGLRAVFTAGAGVVGRASSHVWALRDVSFEVPRGQVVGLVGRNGAGKSTLLKILSRITAPTAGFAEIQGRVGSLLEVGTGFHPELTGRENIFLNGSIIGMRRAEIMKRFDEIVAFAETEPFLDTPVKHYSSGMYMRLAFAVAAHLNPEVLLVDEVLAVGDAGFQRKCLGRMGMVAKEGRTVLFVSHNMDAIRRLCPRTIWLEAGRLKRDGMTGEVLADYLLANVHDNGIARFDPPRPLGSEIPIRLHSVQFSRESGAPTTRFSCRDQIRVRIEWQTLAALRKPRIGLVLQTSTGADVLTSFDATAWADGTLPPGQWVSSCMIPGGLLNEGEYVAELGADSLKGPGGLAYPFGPSRTGPLLRFDVEDDQTMPGKYYGEEGFRDAPWPGVLFTRIPWTQAPADREPR